MRYWENPATRKRRITNADLRFLESVLKIDYRKMDKKAYVRFRRNLRCEIQDAAEEFWYADRLTGKPPPSVVTKRLSKINDRTEKFYSDIAGLFDARIDRIERLGVTLPFYDQPAPVLDRYLGPGFIDDAFDLAVRARKAARWASEQPVGKAGPQSQHKKKLFWQLVRIMNAVKPPEDELKWLSRDDRRAFLYKCMCLIVGDKPPTERTIENWYNDLFPDINRRKREL